MSVPTGFFAYPSQPVALSEIIEGAITKINQGQMIELVSWKSTKISGRFIIKSLLQQIDKADLFCADLTHINANVLFELGYAVAKRKKLWLLFDTSDETSLKMFKQLGLFTAIGYSSYNNIRDIEESFYKEDLISDDYEPLLRSFVNERIDLSDPKSILYLKTSINTEGATRLTNKVQSISLPLKVDDPRETRSQTLSWYVKSVHSAIGVVAHFLGENRPGFRVHNAKCAFVCGFAHGLERQILMLVQEPYEVPIDYKELMYVYSTAKLCEERAAEWLDQQATTVRNRTQASVNYAKLKDARTTLQSLSFGEEQAENEAEQLVNYFVETAAYLHALTERQVVFVGRKGTGKTATFIKVSDTLRSDVRNFICEVKPVDYELEGILTLIKKVSDKAERGFLLESLWKFLLYTELAFAFQRFLKNRPVHILNSSEEDAFLLFCESNSSIMSNSFTLRFEAVVGSLSEIDFNSGNFGQRREKFSENLHDKFLNTLRAHLGNILHNRHKVVFLVDNLDKAWSKTADIAHLSEFIFALLRVQRPILSDFSTESTWKKKIDLSLILFIRSDIYASIIGNAREPDKISIERIRWDDSGLLLKLLEERYLAVAVDGDQASPSDLWDKIFCKSVGGRPVQDYLTKSILPRPRDIVYLCNAALSKAINRGHATIHEEDFLDGEYEYSQYAFNSLLAEDGLSQYSLESVLYEFAGSDCILDTESVKSKLKQAGVTEDKYLSAIDHLITLGFLGVETRDNKFEFLYNEDEKKRLLVLGKNYAAKIHQDPKYLINKPFWNFLGIIDVLQADYHTV